jgi:hypothetical protein
MSATLQRLDWDGVPKKQGDTIRLTKGDRTATRELWSHQFGWELRLEAAGEMLQTQVCRSQEEALSTTEAWRAALESKGWKP